MSVSKDWVPEEAIANLTLRRALQDKEDATKLAAELFKEALPVSVMAMTHLAIHSPTEAIRFQASKYVIDRSMGPVTSQIKPVDERPAWEKLFETVTVEVDAISGSPSTEA